MKHTARKRKGNVMNSVYFLPTNRSIEKCLKSYIKEIAFAKKAYKLDIPIVVVETTNEAFVRHNSSTILKLKEQYPEINIIHMTVELQNVYFETLFENRFPELKELFLSREKNYGTAMNKLFLFTSSFNTDMFHRRDSDTCLISDEIKGAKDIYPIELELKYLKKSVSYIKEELGLAIPDPSLRERKIWVIGGNYFGEWNLDLKDFAKKSYEPIYRLYELLGFSKMSVKDICTKAYQFDKPLKVDDKINLTTSANCEYYPDCGNIAVYKLHEFIPALPGRNTISADYFPFDTAALIGIPILNHSRDVFHEYHSERFNIENKINYWKGILKFADYFNLYSEIFNGSLSNISAIDNQNKISDSFIQNLGSCISYQNLASEKERKDRLKQIINDVLIGFNDNYTIIGKNLLDNLDDYIAEANEEYRLHGELICEWDFLINRAKSIYIPDLIKLSETVHCTI